MKDRRKIGTSRRRRRQIKRKEKGTRLKGCRRDNIQEHEGEKRRREDKNTLPA